MRCELVHPSTGLQFSFCLIYALITTGAALTGDTSRRRWACVRSHLNKCRLSVALVRAAALGPVWKLLIFWGTPCAPPALLVCFAERPAVRCCPLRFVLYVCIVNRTLYKVKRKLYIFLSLWKVYSRLNKTTAVYCVNCTLYKVQKNPGAVFTM